MRDGADVFVSLFTGNDKKVESIRKKRGGQHGRETFIFPS